MNVNFPDTRRGREGLKATPPPLIKCDKCGREEVPAVLRLLVDHPAAKVWTLCIKCDPGGANCAA